MRNRSFGVDRVSGLRYDRRNMRGMLGEQTNKPQSMNGLETHDKAPFTPAIFAAIFFF
jgi:hypothetical protein